MLKLTNLHASYGKIHVVKGISLEVNKGEFVTLIGSKGVGKTTTRKTIMGLLRPDCGSIQFLSQEIAGVRPDKIVNQGIAFVSKEKKIFPFMSVVENLHVGAYSSKEKEEINWGFERVYKFFPQLFDCRRQLARSLSEDQKQMLAIGRVVMTQPKMLILDDPSITFTPTIVEPVFKFLSEIHKQGMTILLFEENEQMALKIADRVYVMKAGRIV
ncbi:ABC transporter ATP-binding protein, partial [Pelosinus sp. UFO1]|uniref:ABC transporter ATP-binding protein n=1 Tax=Pelosinus sp. UFO1 TaxID=484770 RepID=UPI0004D0FB2E